MASDGHTIWVIYSSPVDLPGRFVARKWLLNTPTFEVLQDTSLEHLRRKLPPGLTRIARAEIDDPKIVETWL